MHIRNGYIRNRKSEQIKIARELMDRIDKKKQKLDEFVERNQQGDMSYKEAEEYTICILEVLSEIGYFVYLVDKHELEDKVVIEYYEQKLVEIYNHSQNIFGMKKDHLRDKYPRLFERLESALWQLFPLYERGLEEVDFLISRRVPFHQFIRFIKLRLLWRRVRPV